MTLHWRDSFNGYSTLVYYTLEIIERSTLRHFLMKIEKNRKSFPIESLKPYEWYDMKLKAVNDIGSSRWSRVYSQRTYSAGKIFIV